MRSYQGISLVELLIASSMTLTLLVLVASGLRSGAETVQVFTTSADLIEDTRNAGNIIADSLSRAAFIFPPGTQLSLGAGYTTQNPRGSGGLWTVGQDAIIALIEAPSSHDLRTGSCSDSQRDRCFFFVAYYPVLRSVVTQRASNTAHPGNNPYNDEAWVLYEYRQRLNAQRLPSNEAVVTNYSGNSGNILADFIAADSFTVTFTRCRERSADGISNPRSVACDNNNAAVYSESVEAGSFSLQGRMQQRRGATQTPRYDFSITPRGNLFFRGSPLFN